MIFQITKKLMVILLCFGSALRAAQQPDDALTTFNSAVDKVHEARNRFLRSKTAENFTGYTSAYSDADQAFSEVLTDPSDQITPDQRSACMKTMATLKSDPAKLIK